MYRLLEALSQEFERVAGRAEDVLDEAAPDRADDMLPDWERITRATACSDGGSIEVRRAAVIERLRGRVPSYPALAEVITDMGYTPAFTAWAPFVAGRSTAGDPLTNDEWQHTVGIWHEVGAEADDAALECTVEDLMHLHVLPIFPDWLELSGGVRAIELGEFILQTHGRVHLTPA